MRNHHAKLNLMKMKKGDRASSITPATEGRRRHRRNHARSTIPTRPPKPGEPWVVVDVKAVEPLPKPVTLAAIKAEPKLKAMVLVNNSRLSVQPVTDGGMEDRVQDGRAEIGGAACNDCRPFELSERSLSPRSRLGSSARSITPAARQILDGGAGQDSRNPQGRVRRQSGLAKGAPFVLSFVGAD